VEIIAHRGASHDAPENTLAAIRLGWAQGADAVEIDVHLSQDGQVVVIHDATLHKTAGVRRRVALQTVAELQSFDVGSWKHARFAGERVPTLAEALATIPKGKRLFVEIKCGPECIPAFANTFRASRKTASQVVPIGFGSETMQGIKQALPELEVAWVAEFRRTVRGWSPKAETLIERAKAYGLDALDLDGRGPLDAEFVAKVHAAGLKLYVWTVDSPARAGKLRAAGIDGLTTNKPGWLRKQLI
jgi:glycerophosphoryl diester phosphodiesterase